MDERSFTMRTNEERLNELLAHLDSLDHIHVDEIPQIDLYMDQVTTFMEKHLGELKRYPEDKVLTKTMINNYAKNNLLPSPVRKKYTQEHILLLVFIYYFKNLLSFTDIETVLSYITENHFGTIGILPGRDLHEGLLHGTRIRWTAEGRCEREI